MQGMAKSCRRAGVSVLGGVRAKYERVLTPDALEFVADLARAFGGRISELHALRHQRAARTASKPFGPMPEKGEVRAADWTAFPVRGELLDRRVEIAGNTEHETLIDGLYSGANAFVARCEQSGASGRGFVEGQSNLMDAVRKTLAFGAQCMGKRHALEHRKAVLFVQPRALHEVERWVTVEGEPVSAALVDFGLFFFHNAREQLARGAAPYFYLQKLESRLEARLYNDVFAFAQSALGIPRATIKVTCTVETPTAAMEMDDILWELREHSCGLHYGLGLADDVDSRDTGGLSARVAHFIETCHRRDVHAMGPFSPHCPFGHNGSVDQAALRRFCADRMREVKVGYDGTQVAHPAVVAIAKQVFDAHMPGPSQIRMARRDVAHPCEGPARVLDVPGDLAPTSSNLGPAAASSGRSSPHDFLRMY